MRIIKIIGHDAMGKELKHIPSPVSTALTLCGWCDVDYEEKNGKPDCPTCLKVVEYCKSIELVDKPLVPPFGR